MNRQEIIVVVLLFMALIGWTYMNRGNMAPAQTGSGYVEQESVAGSVSHSDLPDKPLTQAGFAEIKPAAETADKDVPGETGPVLGEETVILSNDNMEVEVSSWGAVVKYVKLKGYKASLHPDSGPVVMDFSDNPALALSGIPEFSVAGDFVLSPMQDGRAVIAESVSSQNMRLIRKIEIDDHYLLKIADTFVNNSDAPVQLKEYSIGSGSMTNMESASSGDGSSFLGIDTLSSQGGSDVVYWAHKGAGGSPELAKRFDEGCRADGGFLFFKGRLIKPLPEKMPPVVIRDGTDWVAVKNKFFVQILAPKDEAAGYVLDADRVVDKEEDTQNARTWRKSAEIASVSASLMFPETSINSGESFEREISCFVGPKKYSLLEPLGRHQDQIMFRAWKGWGWYRWVCGLLLLILNKLYAIVPNYGVAIILLTIIVKIVFWPVMHKSTESMKKMQSLKPMLDELKEKYKGNPQKLQQEQMALYKKHKVNPMASCLPMLIQMPVFIAMFTVIRTAVELRYANFLWISDLSEPERLLDGMIPFAGSLNILPLLMIATMVWQQKLTPSTGDAQQKQMMIIMPVMMLFLLYNMASGLTLYWTVSQVLSIVQLYVQKKST